VKEDASGGKENGRWRERWTLISLLLMEEHARRLYA